MSERILLLSIFSPNQLKPVCQYIFGDYTLFTQNLRNGEMHQNVAQAIPIQVLGNGGQTLFPICAVLEVKITSISDMTVLNPQNIGKKNSLCVLILKCFLFSWKDLLNAQCSWHNQLAQSQCSCVCKFGNIDNFMH